MYRISKSTGRHKQTIFPLLLELLLPSKIFANLCCTGFLMVKIERERERKESWLRWFVVEYLGRGRFSREREKELSSQTVFYGNFTVSLVLNRNRKPVVIINAVFIFTSRASLWCNLSTLCRSRWGQCVWSFFSSFIFRLLPRDKKITHTMKMTKKTVQIKTPMDRGKSKAQLEKLVILGLWNLCLWEIIWWGKEQVYIWLFIYHNLFFK